MIFVCWSYNRQPCNCLFVLTIFFCEFLFYWDYIIYKQRQFSFFLSSIISFFSHMIVLAILQYSVQNNGKRRQLFLIPKCRGRSFRFSSLSVVFSEGFQRFLQEWKILIYSQFLAFLKKSSIHLWFCQMFVCIHWEHFFSLLNGLSY